MRAAVLGLDPYDALMEQYDPGNRAADITPVFAELKSFLRDFIPEALDVQAERLAARPLKPLAGNYPIDRQRELGLAMMGAVGFDFTRGSLSVSHHPVLRRRADRRAHHHALQGVGFPVGADGRAARDRPCALRAEPAARLGALAARQGARHGRAREPEPVRRKAGRPQPVLLAMGAAGRRKTSRRKAQPRRRPAACPQGRARPDPRRRRRGDLSAARHLALRAGAGSRCRPPRCRRHPGSMGRQDARLSRPVDHRHAGRRADAGRALAGRHVRLFPVLHTGRHDGRAAMGGDRKGISWDRERIRRGQVRHGQ